MPLLMSRSLVGIAAAIVIAIGGIGATQGQAPIPVPRGTGGTGGVDHRTNDSPYLDLIASYRDASGETPAATRCARRRLPR